jgi:CBS domain-containing protein
VYLVSELLRQKGSSVHTIAPEATALEAASLMNQHRIGSLMVVAGGRPTGIVTERDMLTRVVAAKRDPATTPVQEIMTGRILTCTPQTSLDEVRKAMREHRIRHIPVIDQGKLAGMISIGDVNSADHQTLVETISYLEAYITH